MYFLGFNSHLDLSPIILYCVVRSFTAFKQIILIFCAVLSERSVPHYLVCHFQKTSNSILIKILSLPDKLVEKQTNTFFFFFFQCHFLFLYSLVKMLLKHFLKITEKQGRWPNKIKDKIWLIHKLYS